MITILIGESGAGKDFLLKESLKLGFENIISYTTRPMRVGEKDGVEYYFRTNREFRDMLKKDPTFFLEIRTYNTIANNIPQIWTYGSPKVNPADKNYMTILDIHGTIDYIKEYGPDNVEIVYIKVPEKIRMERAMLRDPDGFDKKEWDRRAIDDAIKFKEAVSVIDQYISTSSQDKHTHIFYNNNGVEEAKNKWTEFILPFLKNNLVNENFVKETDETIEK